MSNRAATSEYHEKTHSLIRFIGFGGIVALLAAAVAIGKTQAVIESDSAMLKEDQHQTEQVIEEVKVEQQQLTDVDRRVDKLEDKVNAN